MMVKKTTLALAAGLLAAAPLAASAQTTTPRFSLSFELGADAALGGDLHGGATGTVLALPTTVEARSYGDIYGSPLTWNLSMGFAATERGEFRVRLFRTTGESERVQVGNVATLPLFGRFDDLRTTGVDFGYRQYYGSDSPIRPYAGASVGLVRVDAIDGTFTVPAASVTLPDVPFYEKTTAATFSVSGGVMFMVTPRVGLQANVDLRWQGGLSAIDGLAGTGLETINDDSARWSLPVTFGATIRF